MNKIAMSDTAIEVLIPLNRVICIESVLYTMLLVPPSVVLIPLNRVICIEFETTNVAKAGDMSLNPLKSGHMY